jgi:hypothetical protein
MPRFKALTQHLPGSNGESQASKQNILKTLKCSYLKLKSSGRLCNVLWTAQQLDTRAQMLQQRNKNMMIIIIIIIIIIC